MDENQMNAVLNAIGTLLKGTVTISKDVGGETTVETELHPIMALFLVVNAMAHLIEQAGHTNDALQLDLSPDSVRSLMHSLADGIADAVLADADNANA